MQKIMFDNNEAQAQLTELLRKPQAALLLIGSGSSQFVDYPSWPDLLEQIRTKLIPYDDFPDNSNLLQKASFVYNRLKSLSDCQAKIHQYHIELETIFKYKPQTRNHIEFHKNLVRLPFSGIVTTNYDSVMESAIGSIREGKKLNSQCQPIDLCIDRNAYNDRSYRVFQFLRGLNEHRDDHSGSHLHSVLHLHGYWENPQNIILTEEDYAKRYGHELNVSSSRKFK